MLTSQVVQLRCHYKAAALQLVGELHLMVIGVLPSSCPSGDKDGHLASRQCRHSEADTCMRHDDVSGCHGSHELAIGQPLDDTSRQGRRRASRPDLPCDVIDPQVSEKFLQSEEKRGKTEPMRAKRHNSALWLPDVAL